MVLYVCDVPGRYGKATGEDIRENVGIFASDDPRFKEPAWSRLTEEQHWRIITDGSQEYFDSKATALADPSRSAAALDSIPATLEGKVEERVVEALGPEGLQAYQAAKGDEKTTISAAANAINAAYQFLVMLNLGAPAEAALAETARKTTDTS